MVKPLFWHQGLFLQPHHFQLNDLYNRSLMEPLYRFVAPHFWGTAGYEIDEGVLANFVFDLRAGEFFFPDNSHILLGENAVIQAKQFNNCVYAYNLDVFVQASCILGKPDVSAVYSVSLVELRTNSFAHFFYVYANTYQGVFHPIYF